jgi:hypothetical protein
MQRICLDTYQCDRFCRRSQTFVGWTPLVRIFLKDLSDVDLTVRVFRVFENQRCRMGPMSYFISSGTSDQSCSVFANPATAFNQAVVV